MHPAFKELFKKRLHEKGRYWEKFWHPKHYFEPITTSEPTVYLAYDDILRIDTLSVDGMTAAMSVIRGCPRHVFLVLTKRPKKVRDIFYLWLEEVYFTKDKIPDVPKNFWLGVTVENQEQVDERIPVLMRIPAALRWASIEPCLGPIMGGGLVWEDYSLPRGTNNPNYAIMEKCVDWVILGGETGPRARPMHPNWARSVRDECQAANVPFWFKQWGEWHYGGSEVRIKGKPHQDVPLTPARQEHHRMFLVGRKAAGRVLDGRTWEEIPI